MQPLCVTSETRLSRPGVLVGLCAASIGALYTVFARYGIAHGLTPWDLTFLRFAVAGLITLPVLVWLLRTELSVMRAHWGRWAAVALLAGPLFGLFMFGALYFAPPSHAAVFPFTAMSVMGLIMSAIFLGDRITLRKTVGVIIVVMGLTVLAGLSAASLHGRALLGDLLFITAGTLWAGFGVVLRKYKLNPLAATAVISFVALVTYVPVYLLLGGASNLTQVPMGVLLTEVLVQGVIAGGGTAGGFAGGDSGGRSDRGDPGHARVRTRGRRRNARHRRQRSCHLRRKCCLERRRAPRGHRRVGSRWIVQAW